MKNLRTDGIMKQKLDIPKLEDANFAATANSGNCTLILTQGISAKALAMSGLSVVGRDCYGVYPLTGKLLNVKEASQYKNAEFQNIMKILGLNWHGPMDKNSDNVENLRYGHLMIMADQDHNGSYIIGLLISFLYSFWPSLLKVPNFLRLFITPIYKASNKKAKKVERFYSIAEYEAWKNNLGDQATEYQIDDYRGLASIPKAEGKVYFSDLDRHTKNFVWADDKDGDAIDLAFGKNKIEERKDWLRASKPSTNLDLKEKHIRYRDFIHLDFRQYLVANLQRSIPSMVDGLKPDQRNILFLSFKEPIIIQEFNVDELSNYAFLPDYHHGEASLVGTIVGMAQNYVGSNNINLLQPKGQFGTRRMGGKDHGSGRCLFTQLSPITRCLFHEDELVLKYLKDGGRSIEAAWFIPIIPMVLVNGSEGSGTEYSSFIPNYNPQEIICNLRRLLNGEKMVDMDPWYKGFTGTIQKTASQEYTTTGIYKVMDENALSITELPVRRWTQDYKEFLEAASQSGKDKTPFIKDYTAYYDDETVHFKIFMTQDQMKTAEQEGFLKKFKLTTTLSTDDMHLFDANGVIKKYDTPEQIIQEFFDLRLKLYEDRLAASLHELNEAISLLQKKVDFIKRIHDEGKLDILDKEMDVIFSLLKLNDFKPCPKESIPETGYESVANASMTDKKIRELQGVINAKKEEHDKLTKVTAKSLWLRDLTALENQLKEQAEIDMIRKHEGAEKMIYQEETDDSGSEEEEPEIAEEAPKKKAPAKRAAASPLPERANKKRLKW